MPRCVSTRTHNLHACLCLLFLLQYDYSSPFCSLVDFSSPSPHRLAVITIAIAKRTVRTFVGPGTCIGSVWTVPRERRRERRRQDEDANCFSRTKLGCIALLDGASRFFGDSERVARKQFDEFSAKSTPNRVNSRGNIHTFKKNGLVPNNFLSAKN